MLNSKTIIISMTSYPARIMYVGKVWFSIFRQMKKDYNCHCVLVLSETEFPNKELDLPKDLDIIIKSGLVELVWTKTNTRSHKKLMPVLELYPDNPILIIDDDQLRPEGWLSTFINDHKKWPKDILAGRIEQREVDGHFIWRNIKKNERGKIIKYGRPQNGRGGTLYPPHTFNDTEFFDESLYMKYSPTSDESWQYFWCRQNNIWPRATSSYPEDRHLVIQKAQNEKALWNTNKGKYDKILRDLIKVFDKKK